MAAWKRDLREQVIARDGLMCRYCGVALVEPPAGRQPTPAELADLATLDHWVPPGRGGSTKAPANAVLACPPCNQDKAGLTGPEYLLVLAYRALSSG